MTATPDGFTLYGDPTGGFSLYCDRCPFEPLETGQQSQALDDLAERSVEHLKAKHPEPYERHPMAPCTVEPVTQDDLPIGPPRRGMDSLLRRFGHPPVDPYQRSADAL